MAPKIDAKKLTSAASKTGLKKPPKPAAPKEAQMIKKAKDPQQLKKMAEAKAKQRMKMLIRVLVVALTVAIIAGVVYFVKFYGRQPKDAFKAAVEYAYKDNIAKFRNSFTSDSIAMVENSDDKSTDVWSHLIDGITPPVRPKIVSEKITGSKDNPTAELTVNIDGENRMVYMRKEDGNWKINLNVAINPRKITLPDNVPVEYLENFEVSDEPDAWWEEGANAKDEDDGKKDGFFARLTSGKLFKR